MTFSISARIQLRLYSDVMSASSYLFVYLSTSSTHEPTIMMKFDKYKL